MRTPFVAGNWKMNKTIAETRELLSALLPNLNGVDGVECVICPPYLSLMAASELLALAENPSESLKEVHLLKAEIAIQKGDSEDAKRILTALTGDPAAPKWVVVMAEEILKTIQ